jgi:hypothetical protein
MKQEDFLPSPMLIYVCTGMSEVAGTPKGAFQLFALSLSGIFIGYNLYDMRAPEGPSG